MHLTPALIPHSQFHKGSWFIAVENPKWYYFLKKKNFNSISNASFIESVDLPLKELVHFLHSKNIATTPSCSGHYKNRKAYEKIYNTLEKEKEIIRHEGLALKDIETGEIFVYKNKEYHLPWCRQEFLQTVIHYQHKGVLGIRLGNRRKIKMQLLHLKLNDIHLEQKDGIILIQMHAYNEKNNLSCWKKITSAIQDIFLKQEKLISQKKEFRTTVIG